MTPFELVSVIEDADAAEPRGKNRIILELLTPICLDETGQHLGPDPNGGQRYGYTRRQALRMRDRILEAAASDAKAARAAEDQERRFRGRRG